MSEEFDNPSVCQTCINPGQCCRAFVPNVLFPAAMSRAEVMRHVQEGSNPYDGRYEPMPMLRPLRPAAHHAKSGAHKPESVKWHFECTNLDPETGKCMDYENRPKMCRVYEPETDVMCAHYKGSWKGYLKGYAKADIEVMPKTQEGEKE